MLISARLVGNNRQAVNDSAVIADAINEKYTAATIRRIEISCACKSGSAANCRK
tara:strand:+ start:215 stop:376 length:162 start_codon:yes stop_codon:yes gene_type:complete